jgi:hypothetical protein
MNFLMSLSGGLMAGYLLSKGDAFWTYSCGLAGIIGASAGNDLYHPIQATFIAAGGAAVLAHPTRYRLTGIRMRRLLEEFKRCGGAAIEVISGNTAINHIRELARLAQRYQLAASVGSDYHGPYQVWLKLGKLPPLPGSVTPIWHGWDLAKTASA